jgi:hypothetical protein
MNFDLKVREITLETFLLTGKIDNKDIINNLIYKYYIEGWKSEIKSQIDNQFK